MIIQKRSLPHSSFRINASFNFGWRWTVDQSWRTLEIRFAKALWIIDLWHMSYHAQLNEMRKPHKSKVWNFHTNENKALWKRDLAEQQENNDGTVKVKVIISSEDNEVLEYFQLSGSIRCTETPLMLAKMVRSELENDCWWYDINDL